MVLSALEPYAFLLQTLIGIYIYIYTHTYISLARSSHKAKYRRSRNFILKIHTTFRGTAPSSRPEALQCPET